MATEIKFDWCYGRATSVYLAGTFNSWTYKDPAYKMVFSYIFENRNRAEGQGRYVDVYELKVKLAKGQHQYKFIVDGEWHYDPKKPTITDPQGNINNVITID
eukprot:Colp12_sorted_trinity150504_noHs@18435